MNPHDRAILITSVEYLRCQERNAWTYFGNIYLDAQPGMKPQAFIDILLTACDDGDSSVQLMECDDNFNTGPGFRLLPGWWEYLNTLAGDP